jgi:hypothetical protein
MGILILIFGKSFCSALIAVNNSKLMNDLFHFYFPTLKPFLLMAPTFTKKQLDEIVKTRKAINQWRTK